MAQVIARPGQKGAMQAHDLPGPTREEAPGQRQKDGLRQTHRAVTATTG